MPRLTRRDIALLLGIATALHTWFAWASWRPLPVVQDEFSYVLQASIFASGHWVAAPPPSEPAFQQSHVVVSPVLASKYPPGHALLLALGDIVDAVWLVPLVLTGISAGVLFFLMTEYATTLAALVGWAFWLSDPVALRYRPGYFSENTSGLAWLLAWWLFTKWRVSPQRRYLVGLGVAVGWCAITRPLTAVALALPLAATLASPLVRRRAWKDISAAIVATLAVVIIFGVANYTVTRNPLKTAFSLYADQYLPIDRLGFHIDSAPPRFPLSPPNAETYGELQAVHVDHTLTRLPSIAFVRLKALSVDEWSGWRLVFLPIAALGLWALSTVGWIAIANGAVLFLIYLLWAHWQGWTLYYFESLPVLALLVANGLRQLIPRVPHRRLTLAVATGLALAFAVGIWRTTMTWRAEHERYAHGGIGFQNMLKSLPFAGAVVFVKYSNEVPAHSSLVANSPTWKHDPIWVVNSWGPATDLKLMPLAAQRVPLLFDEKTRLIGIYRELLDSLRRKP